MRRFARLCVFLALLWSAPGFAAVALDVAGSETLTAAGVSSPQTYTGLTTGGSLSNGAVSCIVITDTHVAGGAGTWDSVSMTRLKSAPTASGLGQVEIYGLSPIGAHTGAKTFSYSWTGGTTAQVMMMCQSWTGVDQTGGATSFPNANSATGSGLNGNTSVTITSAVGDAVIAGHVVGSSFTAVNNTGFTMTSGAGWDNTPANTSIAANRAAGASPNVAMTATFSGGVSVDWASAGTDILAFTGGGATCPMTRSLMGVGC